MSKCNHSLTLHSSAVTMDVMGAVEFIVWSLVAIGLVLMDMRCRRQRQPGAPFAGPLSKKRGIRLTGVLGSMLYIVALCLVFLLVSLGR